MNNRQPMCAFVEAIKTEMAQGVVSAVIMYGTLGSTGFNSQVIRYCHKKNVRVLYDYVDLFDKPSKNNLLRYFMKMRENRCLQKKVLPACDGYIAISRYLKNLVPHPEKAVIIPPLATEVVAAPGNSNDTICVSYASYISDKNRPVSEWKDRLDAVVNAFYGLFVKEGIDNFLLQFIGFVKDDLIAMFPYEQQDEYRQKLAHMKKNVVFCGKMSNAAVRQMIYDSDFTILLRDSKTSTNAGFPTKVSESMAMGVPVLANITSDIATYMTDGENGIVLPPPDDVAAISQKLKKVLSLSVVQRQKMKATTISTCKFHFSQYVKEIEKAVVGEEK